MAGGAGRWAGEPLSSSAFALCFLSATVQHLQPSSLGTGYSLSRPAPHQYLQGFPGTVEGLGLGSVLRPKNLENR